MSALDTGRGRPTQRQLEEWRASFQPANRGRSVGGPHLGLLVTGAIVVGLGFLAWNYLGPDLRRYIKMSNM